MKFTFLEREARMFPTLMLPTLRPSRLAGPLLHSTSLAADPDVLGLNLTRGCVHRCGFCHVRANPANGPDEAVEAPDNLLERLERELLLRRPRAVLVSPSADPFPPLESVQHLAAEVVRTLTRNGVGAWFLTRGLIRTPALAVIAERPELVRVTVALTTLDRSLQRRIEPWTAPPQLRLNQIERLRSMGVAVQVALDPMLPGVTDTGENLEQLMDALAEVGVRQITAGYVFLRPGIVESLEKDLRGTGLDETILGEFRDGPVLAASSQPPSRYLPKARRQRGYARLMALGAARGI
jgi:DNA repair photolyase